MEETSQASLVNCLRPATSDRDETACRLALRLPQHLSADERIELLMSHLKSTEPRAEAWQVIVVYGLALAPMVFLALACLS